MCLIWYGQQGSRSGKTRNQFQATIFSQKLTEFDVIHSDLLESVDHMKCQLDEFNLLESISIFKTLY